MRTVTALQAGRSLGALLDQVQAGESIVITRDDGNRIAVIEPVAEGNGAEVLALLKAPVDADFARDVALARTHGQPLGGAQARGDAL